MSPQKAKFDRSGPSKKTSSGPGMSAQVMPTDLAGWIKFYEAWIRARGVHFGPVWVQITESSLKQIQTALKLGSYWIWARPDRKESEKLAGDLPEKPTYAEALGERLLVAWTDHRLWKMIRQGSKYPPPGPHTIDADVKKWISDYHHLEIPFSASVWLELAQDPRRRDYLFQLMVMLAAKFFSAGAANQKNQVPAEWKAQLSKEDLGELLYPYVHFPGQDWRMESALTLEELPQEVLKHLQESATRLANDLSHIIRYPHRTDARRAPAISVRTRKWEEAWDIEQMVLMLRENPDLSDYSLAKQHLGVGGSKRKLANEARWVALYREQIPVTFRPPKEAKT